MLVRFCERRVSRSVNDANAQVLPIRATPVLQISVPHALKSLMTKVVINDGDQSSTTVTVGNEEE